jgi:aryl-alcohol dehydrogenase-like predicted oxidoreductase
MTTIDTRTRRLSGTEVFPIGLGAMPMALSGRPSEEQSIRTIHAALDAGVNLIDTADAYCIDESEVGHNERLIAKALQGRYDDVIVATKAGHIRPGGAWEIDGRPEHIRAACEASLKALGTDRIDLYQYHRPDPNVPYAESVGAFKELQDEGKVRWIGLSNCNNEQLEEALGVAEIVSVQNQLSLGYTGPLGKGEVDACTDRELAFLPWSPLGGIGKADGTAEVDPVRRAAEEHGVSPQQVALAWLLSLGPTVIPIPGASRPQSITDSARAPELELGRDELDAITEVATKQ